MFLGGAYLPLKMSHFNSSRRSRKYTLSFHHVPMLLPESESILRLKKATFDRAKKLEQLGFKPADAVHIAAAERAKADVFLSCDDRLCRLAMRRKNELLIPVANPVDWLKEFDDDDA